MTNHQETPTDAADDTAAFGETHAAELRDTSHSVRACPSAAPTDCIYVQVHKLRAAYIDNRINDAAVPA